MKRNATRLAAPLAAAILALAAACGGAAQSESTTPAAPASDDGTEPVAEETGGGDTPDAVAQAERGADVYSASCSYCHGDDGEGAGTTPAVIGDGVLDSYANAGDLLDYVSAEMPADDPGGLSTEEFQDVVAYMIQANGVDLTGQSVSSASAGDIAF